MEHPVYLPNFAVVKLFLSAYINLLIRVVSDIYIRIIARLNYQRISFGNLYQCVITKTRSPCACALTVPLALKSAVFPRAPSKKQKKKKRIRIRRRFCTEIYINTNNRQVVIYNSRLHCLVMRKSHGISGCV